MASTTVLGFVGLGVMGEPMCKNLAAKSGARVVAFDPRSAPLDPWCRFRGVENLFVVDASFMPTGGGVNPSLTIAANALRVAEAIATDRLPSTEEKACRTTQREHFTSRSSAVASPRS